MSTHPKRVLIAVHSGSAPYFIRLGWSRAFEAAGYHVCLWSPEEKPVIAMFDEFEPDIYIDETYQIKRAHLKAIKSRPNVKVALFGSAYGSLTTSLDRMKYPIDVAHKEELATIYEMKEKLNKPDFIFIHHPDKYLQQTMGYWKTEVGVDIASILNGADAFEYCGGYYEDRLACDVGYVGGYWAYKSKNINKFLLPLCNSSKYNIKIFGNTPWSVAQYLGTIDGSLVKNLFVSAKVCPNFSEPHSTDYGFDIVERPFKIMAAGGLCISDYVEGACDILPDMPTFKTYNEMVDLIDKGIRGDLDEVAVKCRDHVLSHHTYFDRVAKMLDLFQMDSSSVLEAKENFVKPFRSGALC